ncbi:dihydroneopterin aldolase [Verruconis gallopava]|uniref:dihydroneopterin aldolase n=1 Tax=Verruconis gallopava TaxID=253628 RepID=A0A0D2A4C5_9PEZI|nr:dihydroneopterin aldolase [Verruconis gallopava]KIW01315.1 dihydroneopterin aldolase [Verruconis gallopava]
MDVLDLLLESSSDSVKRWKPAASDIVFVRDVQIQARVGSDAWERDKAQPVIVSARLPFSISQAGKTDDISHTLDYRTIYKTIRFFDTGESASSTQHGGLISLTETIADALKVEQGAQLVVEAPKAFLHSDGVIVKLHCLDSDRTRLAALAIKQLHIPCIIGIGAHERLQKQPVIVDLAVPASEIKSSHSLPNLLRNVFTKFESSTFLTLEAFATALARYIVMDLPFTKVAVSAYKPSVFSMAEGPGVQILRNAEYFETENA